MTAQTTIEDILQLFQTPSNNQPAARPSSFAVVFFSKGHYLSFYALLCSVVYGINKTHVY